MGITFTRSIPTKESLTSIWRASVAGLIAFAAILYIGCFGGEKVWDDHILLDGSAIGGGDSLLHCFNQQFMYNYYRPLVSASFYVENRAFGGRLVGYHLVSLAFHLLTVYFVIGLTNTLTRNRRSALLAGLFFAIQPVQVSATAWLGGRTDAMACCWSALFGWMILKTLEERGISRFRYIALASLAFLLAIFTKEQTLALLPLVPMVFYFHSSKTDRARLAGSIWSSIPFVIIAVLFIVIGSQVGLPHPNGIQYSTSQRLEFIGNAGWHYLQLLTLPGPLSLHAIGFSGMESGLTWRVVVGLGVLFLTLAVFLFSLKRDRTLAFCLGWIMLSLVPVLNLIPAPFLLLGPYRAALAGIGASVLFGYGVSHAIGLIDTTSPRRPTIRTAVFVGLSGLLILWHTAVTLPETLRWRNEEQVFRNFLASDPKNIMMLQTMGVKHQSLERHHAAASSFETALDQVFGANWSDADQSLSHMQSGTREYNLVRQFQGGDDDPSHWVGKTYCLLGESYFKLDRLEESEKMFHAAEKFDRGFVHIHTGLGGLYESQNKFELAMTEFRTAIDLDPKNVYAISHLAKLLAEAKRFRESTAYYERWVALEPASKAAQDSLTYTKAELAKYGN